MLEGQCVKLQVVFPHLLVHIGNMIVHVDHNNIMVYVSVEDNLGLKICYEFAKNTSRELISCLPIKFVYFQYFSCKL